MPKAEKPLLLTRSPGDVADDVIDRLGRHLRWMVFKLLDDSAPKVQLIPGLPDDVERLAHFARSGEGDPAEMVPVYQLLCSAFGGSAANERQFKALMTKLKPDTLTASLLVMASTRLALHGLPEPRNLTVAELAYSAGLTQARVYQELAPHVDWQQTRGVPPDIARKWMKAREQRAQARAMLAGTTQDDLPNLSSTAGTGS